MRGCRGSQDLWVADHRWGPAGGETPQSLVLGATRQSVKALGHSEAFATALAFISISLCALVTSQWQRMAVDAEVLADAGAVGSVAASTSVVHPLAQSTLSGSGAPAHPAPHRTPSRCHPCLGTCRRFLPVMYMVNKHLPLSCLLMKPYPFFSLNHMTEPRTLLNNDLLRRLSLVPMVVALGIPSPLRWPGSGLGSGLCLPRMQGFPRGREDSREVAMSGRVASPASLIRSSLLSFLRESGGKFVLLWLEGWEGLELGGRSFLWKVCGLGPRDLWI